MLSGLTILDFLFWATGYMVTAILGSALIRAVFPVSTRTPFVWLGGFWLGYLGITALSRLWSLALTGPVFYAVTMISALGLSIWQWRKSSKLHGQAAKGLLLSPIILLALPAILALQIFQGPFRWNGHGTYQYAEKAVPWHLDRIPILLQHYDEVLFHHFLVGPDAQPLDPIIPWWLTLGLNKISIFAFFLIFFGALGLSRIRSFTASAFLLLGTTSILPWSYYMLFDSSNPLGFTVHSGRLVVAPIIALFWLWLKEDFVPPRWAQILLGIGITMTPFSNFAWIPVLFFLHKVMRNHDLRLRALQSLALVPLMYIYPSKLTAWLNFGCLVYIFRSSWRDLKLGKAKTEFLNAFREWPFKDFAISLLVSNLLLGNIFVSQPLGKGFAKLLGLAQVNLLDGGFHIANIGRFFQDHRELQGDYNIYNRSTFAFIAVYGFFLFLMFVALNMKADGKLRAWLSATVLLTAATFFTVDFVGLSTRSWLMTRLLEAPIYLSLSFALIIVLKSSSRWVTPLLGLFMVAPFIGSGRIQQIVANAKLFKSLWIGR